MALLNLRHGPQTLPELSDNFRSLSMNRFIDLKDNRKDGIPVEYQVIQLIDDALGLIVQIGKKLEGILASPFRKIDQREGSLSSTPVIISRTDFYLPDKGREIISGDCLDGKTVTEALRFVVVLCFTAAAFFRNSQTLYFLDRESQIDENLGEIVDELNRIASADVLKELSLTQE